MAVVQNLARLPASLLAACQTSAEILDDVCSFRALHPRHYLDLNWSPYLLEQTAVTSALPAELVSLLRESTDGNGEVNRAYRDSPSTVMEHPVSSLVPERVLAVSAGLEALSRIDWITQSHVLATLDRLPNWQGIDDAVQYLQDHFVSLRTFYRLATAERLAVVMWWD